MAQVGILTPQADGGAGGLGSYVVRHLALVKASIIHLQFDDVERDGAARFDNLILPAVLQQLLVFRPGYLEGWTSSHITVQAGVFSPDPL